MATLMLGTQAIEPHSLVALSAAEWEQRRHDWAVVEDDRLYFRCDGVIYEACFVMATRLTDLVLRAVHNGQVQLWLDGRTAEFLRSEDQERFTNRMAREKAAEG